MPDLYYRAESENGDTMDDPSEDGLFMLIDKLNATDNTFVIIQPDQDDPPWYASVAVLEEGGYEVELKDMRRRDHEVATYTEIGRIAWEVTIWLAARDYPGRPVRDLSEGC